MPLGPYGDTVAVIGSAHFDDGSPSGSYSIGFGDVGYAWRWDRVYVSNTDSIDHHIMWDPTGGNGDGEMGVLTVPARAGYDGTPAFEILTSQFDASAQWWETPTGKPWQFGLVEAMSAGTFLHFIYRGGV